MCSIPHECPEDRLSAVSAGLLQSASPNQWSQLLTLLEAVPSAQLNCICQAWLHSLKNNTLPASSALHLLEFLCNISESLVPSLKIVEECIFVALAFPSFPVELVSKATMLLTTALEKSVSPHPYDLNLRQEFFKTLVSCLPTVMMFESSQAKRTSLSFAVVSTVLANRHLLEEVQKSKQRNETPS